jgi:Flp pilus assembly protein TadD
VIGGGKPAPSASGSSPPVTPLVPSPSTASTVSAPASGSSAARERETAAAQLLRLGAAAQQEGDQARALDCFLRAVDARPNDWVAHTCVGTALKALGHLDDAIAMHRRAVELGGDHRALSNLALAYRAAFRLDEAIAALRLAVARAPQVAELHGNLAGLLLAADQPALAEASARAALALAPGEARFETNLGYARKEQGDLAGAAAHLRRAIAYDADDANAHWNLALTLLTAPASAEEERAGWQELEWRQQIPGLRVALNAETAAIPRWSGEPLEGRALLLRAEQGLGDTLQLARYARAAKRLAGAGQTILECQPALARVLGRCAGVDRVVPRGAKVPHADLRAGLFSLPPWLGGRGAGDGGQPYLDAEPERVASWRAHLADLTGGARFRVGIAWQGNRRYRADGRRSIPLGFFGSVVRAVQAAGGALVSLQKGDGREQLTALLARPVDRSMGEIPIIDLAPALDLDGAFVDTAAVIAGLDLVITSDTAIPHLAGGLGAPVWLALAHLPDWRWGLSGDTSPWYPSMRVFRQSRAGDWGEVFDRIARAVCERFGGGAGDAAANGAVG